MSDCKQLYIQYDPVQQVLYFRGALIPGLVRAANEVW
jgi:hypothetical protein